MLHTQLTHPRVAHILLFYKTTITSFTKKGKKKVDEGFKVQLSRGWIVPESSFKENDKLFAMYKIVIEYTTSGRLTTKIRTKRVAPLT